MSLRPNAAALLLLAAPAAWAAVSPCSGPGHSEFDFWLGEWLVYAADGRLAGNNRIEREYNGCVVHERYRGTRGYLGESLNIFDASRQTWHQTWVDSDGLLLELEGGIRDGQMVLNGESRAADGSRLRQRITWTPNRDGTVRQLWETGADDGRWSVSFDGLYRRAGPRIG